MLGIPSIYPANDRLFFSMWCFSHTVLLVVVQWWWCVHTVAGWNLIPAGIWWVLLIKFTLRYLLTWHMTKNVFPSWTLQWYDWGPNYGSLIIFTCWLLLVFISLQSLGQKSVHYAEYHCEAPNFIRKRWLEIEEKFMVRGYLLILRQSTTETYWGERWVLDQC